MGQWLTRRLVGAGCQVLIPGRSAPGALPDGVHFVPCDISDAAAVERAFTDASIDYVVHLAACVGDWGPYSEYEATNVHGTRNVLEAAVRAGVRRIVHVSSIAVMGFHPGEHADERTGPVRSDEPYSDTKARGEEIALELAGQGAPIVVVRPGDIYGIGSESWVVRPLEMMKKGQMVKIDGGHGHFAPTHVENLIDGILLAIQRPEAVGRVYLITDGDGMEFHEYFARLALVCGLPPGGRSVPSAVLRPIATVLELAAHVFGFKPPITRRTLRFVSRTGSYDITRARTELGYTPRVGMEQALQEIGAHYGRL